MDLSKANEPNESEKLCSSSDILHTQMFGVIIANKNKAGIRSYSIGWVGFRKSSKQNTYGWAQTQNHRTDAFIIDFDIELYS